MSLLVSGTVLVVALAREATRAEPGPAPGARSSASEVHLPRLVDLGAGRCVPCREMAPILAELREDYAGRAEIMFIDVWKEPERAGAYRFRAIPTQIFYDREGREVWRHEGFLGRREIVARLRGMGVE